MPNVLTTDKTGRVARLIEFDPAYCDTIVRRWQAYTGKHAVLAATGQRFEDIEQARIVCAPANANHADDVMSQSALIDGAGRQEKAHG